MGHYEVLNINKICVQRNKRQISTWFFLVFSITIHNNTPYTHGGLLYNKNIENKLGFRCEILCIVFSLAYYFHRITQKELGTDDKRVQHND